MTSRLRNGFASMNEGCNRQWFGVPKITRLPCFVGITHMYVARQKTRPSPEITDALVRGRTYGKIIHSLLYSDNVLHPFTAPGLENELRLCHLLYECVVSILYGDNDGLRVTPNVVEVPDTYGNT